MSQPGSQPASQAVNSEPAIHVSFHYEKKTTTQNGATIKNAEFQKVPEANPERFQEGYLNEYSYVRVLFILHIYIYIYIHTHTYTYTYIFLSLPLSLSIYI